MISYRITIGDLTSDAVLALLQFHLQQMQANTPNGHVFALDASGLKQPDVTVWTAWDDTNQAGIAALKQLDNGESGEIKSMRTHPDYLRQGVAGELLAHIIKYAKSCGYKHLSLETGRGEEFEPALRLYRAHGFSTGAPFGDYEESEFSQYFHLTL